MVLQEHGRINPRADSFSLYLNYVANTMLQNILPKQKLDLITYKMARGCKPDKQVFQTVSQSNNQVIVSSPVKVTPVKAFPLTIKPQ